MKSPPIDNLLDLWKTCTILIHRQARDITQAESLLQPTPSGNSMNWVLGHILTGRDTCLRHLGLEPVLTEAEKQVYDRGSETLTGPAGASDIATLLEKIDVSHRRLAAAIEARGQDGLEDEVDFGGVQPLGGVLAFLQWHETYHLGQLEILRQMAGKTNKVI